MCLDLTQKMRLGYQPFVAVNVTLKPAADVTMGDVSPQMSRPSGGLGGKEKRLL